MQISCKSGFRVQEDNFYIPEVKKLWAVPNILLDQCFAEERFAEVSIILILVILRFWISVGVLEKITAVQWHRWSKC